MLKPDAVTVLAGGAVGGGAAWLVSLAGFGLTGGSPTLAWVGAGGITVLGFFALGQFVQVLTAEADTIVVMVAALTSYAVRAAGLAVVLLLAQPLASGSGADALAPTMIVVVFGWLTAEIWTFTRLRVPVFDPAQGDRH